MDRGRQPSILLLVVKNTSALDYTLPLLWRIKREHPQATVSVVYCTLSRRKILRRAAFYSAVLKSQRVAEYDLLDFLRPPYGKQQHLWRRLCSKSRWDSAWWQQALPQLAVGPLSSAAIFHLKQLLGYALLAPERFLADRINAAGILPALAPDITLFDHRYLIGPTDFPGRDSFLDYWGRVKKKLVLLPHAPHHTGTTAFTPFQQNDRTLPEYCEYWMPFSLDRTWEGVPDQKERFAYVGYPGLDSEWLAWLQSRRSHRRICGDGDMRSHRPLRCALIIRKFLRRGQARPPGHDAYVFDHTEFRYYLRLVREAIRRCQADIELVVKPHPSNDYRSLRQELEASGIGRWRISHESIYAEVPRCDFVISLYSTTLLIPAMAGIPVILLHSRIQDEIHQWEEMKQLYTGLGHYLDNPEDLADSVNEVVDSLRGRGSDRRTIAQTDVEHLRKFYPDGATQRCLERLGV